jgi:hypothetical protein
MTTKSPGLLDKEADKAVRKAAEAHGFKVKRVPPKDPEVHRYDEYVFSGPVIEKWTRHANSNTGPLRTELAIMFCKGWPQPYRYIREHRKELPWATLPL